jgi:DNA polymerase I-like protein with 3'-5' exonuclease and polymerase domains
LTILKVVVLDTETKVRRIKETNAQENEREIIDGSPFHPGNRIVTVGWRTLTYVDDSYIGPFPNNYRWSCTDTKSSVYGHNDYPEPDSPTPLQEALNEADIIVCHNAKFDIEYLLESGFTIPDRVWCTMVGEYVLARGTRVELSLEQTAIRRKTSLKQGEVVHTMFKEGIGYEAMPLELVLEYMVADVVSCSEIFMQQWSEFQDETKTRKLSNIVTLMNEMLIFLVEIERNGVAIDVERLKAVGEEYELERDKIQVRLQEIVEEVMGDTPINLNSGDDISKVVYSRELINKPLHRETFNIGVDKYGKSKFAPYMSPNQFTNAVRTTTKRIEKKQAFNCPECKGTKFIRKRKVNGDFWKNESRCPTCDGLGFVLIGTGKVAGLKLNPESPRDASIGGFKVGADEIDRLIAQAQSKDNLLAVEFLTKKKRLNAINTYINSFVNGIQRWTREDGLLHPSFNQCVARTGRLSSSDPNFQNQPKGRKFPVRKSIISRWKDIGGLILEADFSGLEFVVAGELSKDPQIIEDITTGKDIHGQTASIVTEQPDPTINWKDAEHKPIRDANKPYTFAPLYGGQGANEPEHIKKYFKEFFKIYKGHAEWQFQQMDDVITKGYVVTPSGREYVFPNTIRLRGRKTSNATNIVNYPVQGFATGDIVPLACVRALREFRRLGLRSLLILTVHDSIVVDVYPNEKDEVVKALKFAMTEMNGEIKDRWDYEMTFDLKCEMAIGPNWGEMDDIH